MNIHTRLRGLILITLVPIALFGIAGAFVMVSKERETLARGVRDQVRAIMGSVDTELRASIAPLQLLARSPNLDHDDLDEFRDEARRALEVRKGDWVNILVSHPETAAMVLNLLATPEIPSPTPADPKTILDAARSGQPTISDVIVGPILKRPLFAVQVPVLREGNTRYVLSAVIETNVFERLLERQGLPPSLTVAVLDANYRFIVRLPIRNDRNEYASDSLRQSLAATNEGWQRGALLDGTEVYRAFHRSPFSGWSTSMAIPRDIVEKDVPGTWLLLAGFVAAAVLGLWIAWILAARLTRPIAALAAAAPALGRGDPSALPPPSSIDEVRELSRALHEAAVAIRSREERQKAAEQSLLQADRAKDEFLAMLGHELRNPLASVANVAQLLEFAESRPELIKGVRDILGRQVVHMTQLLDDLLEVGRIAGGKIRLHRSPLDLGAITAELIAGWRSGDRFDQYDVHVAIEPAWISCDRVRIEQVISNLLDNALKYTPAGGRIDVLVRTDGTRALLEVRDTGEGIGEGLIERVFDLFVQGERSLAREQGGLGIGLTMAKRLVELHDGTISAASPGAGLGATFTVSLPRIDQPAPAVAATAAAAKARLRILIVEDNIDARESLVALLHACGHDVRNVDNGEAALAAAAEFRPDVMLVDIGLPDMDGYEVARQLRRLPGLPAMVLIALTGYGSPEDRHRAVASGFAAHLIKPLDLQALEAALREHSSTP